MDWLRWIDLPMFLAFAVYVLSRWAWDARHMVGMSMAAVGFALWLTARLQLGKSFSVRAEARKLVTTGLYSKFRNPVYLFGGVAYAGLWLAVAPTFLIVFLPLYSLFQYLRVRKEDAVLEAAFGDEYRSYRARTWI